MDGTDDRWQRQQERWTRRQERWARKQQRRAMRQSPMHGVVVGSIIVTVGVLFLLDNLGILRFQDAWQYWPVILIVIGVVRLADAHGPSAIIWGAVIAGIGGLLLADNLNLIYFDWRMVWPILLIAWGLIILLRQLGMPWGPPRFVGSPPGAVPPNPAAAVDSSTIGLWTLFGGGRRQIDSQDFRGGEISAIFGGYEVDLRNAMIAADPAVIDVTAIFGGVEMKVPGTWTVEVRGVGIFGGFGDETRPPRPGEVTREQRLIVTGTAAFGGVSIKN